MHVLVTTEESWLPVSCRSRPMSSLASCSASDASTRVDDATALSTRWMSASRTLAKVKSRSFSSAWTDDEWSRAKRNSKLHQACSLSASRSPAVKTTALDDLWLPSVYCGTTCLSTQQTLVVYANFVHHLAKAICLYLEQLILCDVFMVLTFLQSTYIM